MYAFYSAVAVQLFVQKIAVFTQLLVLCLFVVAHCVVTSCCCSAHESVIHLNGL